MAYFIMPGDAKETLKGLPDNSVDSFVMDPPYDLVSIQKRFGKEGSAPAQFGTDGVFQRKARGFMGKTWDGTGIAFDVKFWAEVVRVLKPGGHVAAFGGSRTYHRMAVAMEDAGLEIRDSLFWVYGSGFPKSLDISKAIDKAAGAEREVVGEKLLWGHNAGSGAGSFSKNQYEGMTGVQRTEAVTAPATEDAQKWDGWGTALKPAQEPIVLARKPISESSIAANVLRWGTGAINIGASRVAAQGRPSRLAVDRGLSRGTYEGGAAKGGGSIANGTTNLGRWPANVLLTCCGMVPHRPGCPILELDRQSGITKSSGGEPLSGEVNRYGIYGKRANPTGKGVGKGDVGGASRYFANLDYDADLDDLVPFFYTAKASRKERDLGLEDLPDKAANELVDRKPGTAGLESPRAGAGRTSGGRNTHPTVKPLKLIEWLIKLITPPGGVTVDCFMGSGTSGMAAVLNGFDFIGMELTDEYIPIAKGRIAWAAKRKEQMDREPIQGTIFDELEGGDDARDDATGQVYASGPGKADEGRNVSERPGGNGRQHSSGRTQEALEGSYQLPFGEDTGDAEDIPDNGLVEGTGPGDPGRAEHASTLGD